MPRAIPKLICYLFVFVLFNFFLFFFIRLFHCLFRCINVVFRVKILQFNFIVFERFSILIVQIKVSAKSAENRENWLCSVRVYLKVSKNGILSVKYIVKLKGSIIRWMSFNFSSFHLNFFCFFIFKLLSLSCNQII